MGEIDDLRAAVAALEARVQLLEDHLAITQLVAQYGPTVDSGSAEATADLWTENGTFDAVGAIEMQWPRADRRHGAQPRAPGSDRQRLRPCADRPACGSWTGDEAQGRSYALNIRWDPERAALLGGPAVGKHVALGAHTEEGWRIAERVNANLDGTPEHRAMLAPST